MALGWGRVARRKVFRYWSCPPLTPTVSLTLPLVRSQAWVSSWLVPFHQQKDSPGLCSWTHTLVAWSGENGTCLTFQDVGAFLSFVSR